VAGHAAVSVDDDLAPGQAGVGVGAAELERPRRVAEQREVVLGELRRQQRPDDVVEQVGLEQRFDVDAGLVLGRDQYGVEADGPVALVLDRDLRLPVRPEIGQDPGFADLGEPNIIPWSPAPTASRASSFEPVRRSSAALTPWAMLGDCSSIDTTTPQVLPSNPYDSRS
jgi:hypothetical protein